MQTPHQASTFAPLHRPAFAPRHILWPGPNQPMHVHATTLSLFHNERVRKMPSLILLDRDGVVNQDVGAPGVLQTSQLQLTPNAGKSIGEIHRSVTGCKVALITNQSCVGKNLIAEDQLQNIHETLQDMLLEEDDDAILDQIFYCTSLSDSGDHRMKPNPGMIEEACRMFNVDASDCVFIGDAMRDLDAATSAGVPHRILVETGYGRGLMHGRSAPEDGSLEVIDDKFCEEFQKPLGIVNSNTNGESVLPFFYAKNLYDATSCILSGNFAL